MIEIRKTEIFDKWFEKLKDRQAKARIQARIDRMEMGHFGDVGPVGGGVSELRIFYGPGYRIYFIQPTSVVVILLCAVIKILKNQTSPRLKTLPSNWRNKPWLLKRLAGIQQNI